ncbi:hypothetical protein BX600DRAFT_460601 [Xylariales sp. PMI_506]|nr:hypothetical protein BX600DRAFT_460601 [Xylariales sp. PMI_506]
MGERSTRSQGKARQLPDSRAPEASGLLITSSENRPEIPFWVAMKTQKKEKKKSMPNCQRTSALVKAIEPLTPTYCLGSGIILWYVHFIACFAHHHHHHHHHQWRKSGTGPLLWSPNRNLFAHRCRPVNVDVCDLGQPLQHQPLAQTTVSTVPYEVSYDGRRLWFPYQESQAHFHRWTAFRRSEAEAQNTSFRVFSAWDQSVIVAYAPSLRHATNHGPRIQHSIRDYSRPRNVTSSL